MQAQNKQRFALNYYLTLRVRLPIPQLFNFRVRVFRPQPKAARRLPVYDPAYGVYAGQ